MNYAPILKREWKGVLRYVHSAARWVPVHDGEYLRFVVLRNGQWRVNRKYLSRPDLERKA